MYAFNERSNTVEHGFKTMEKAHTGANMLELAGYQFFEKIYENQSSRLYKGCRTIDDLPVIAKVRTKKYPTIEETQQLENEYAIVSQLNLPGVIQQYSLELVGQTKVIIMEDFNALSLKDYMKTTACDLRTFLKLAIEITEILSQIHQQDIIHRDIKPSNILINPEFQKIKFCDFGIACRLNSNSQSLINTEETRGTLHYISPEQTGRINRAVSFRSDLYSLGIVFFELLTLKLPFDFQDPAELIHAHITKQPLPPSDIVDIPEIVSDIVLKLLAKMSEDRYQNASGLKHDLERCYQDLHSNT